MSIWVTDLLIHDFRVWDRVGFEELVCIFLLRILSFRTTCEACDGSESGSKMLKQVQLKIPLFLQIFIDGNKIFAVSDVIETLYVVVYKLIFTIHNSVYFIWDKSNSNTRTRKNIIIFDEIKIHRNIL